MRGCGYSGPCAIADLSGRQALCYRNRIAGAGLRDRGIIPRPALRDSAFICHAGPDGQSGSVGARLRDGKDQTIAGLGHERRITCGVSRDGRVIRDPFHYYGVPS